MKHLSLDSIVVVSALPIATTALKGVILRLDSDDKPYYCNGTTWVDLTATGSLVPNSGTISVTFSSDGDLATATVSAAWVASNSKILCFVLGDTTVDHDPLDHLLEELKISVYNIVDGVSFDITAYSPVGTHGTYNIYWEQL